MATHTIIQSNPFPGLRAFAPEEHELFFGREEQIDELLNKLRLTHFLVIVGTSGSGKTSLVNCGLLPALNRGFEAKAGSSWKIAHLQPGDNPIRNLALQLSRPGILYNDDKIEPNFPSQVERQLRESSMGLVEAYRSSHLNFTDNNLLIYVDQFEELFKLKQQESNSVEGDKNDAIAFVNLLLAASREKELPLYVVLTMRSDFIGHITEFRDLPEAINEGQYLIARMGREALRKAILGPIIRHGASITPRLVQLLMDDFQEESTDQLPIFQHSLMRTWENWQKNAMGERPINVYDYDAIGTMSEALSQHINEAYAELKTDEDRRICEVLFKAITDKSAENIGISRTEEVSTIAAIAEVEPEKVIKVIELFRRPGRSFLTSSTGDLIHGSTQINISHESLMRVWRRLLAWVDEETQSADLYRRLSEGARLKMANKAGYWKDPELQLALNWRDENRPNKVWSQRYNYEWDQAITFLEESDEKNRAAIAREQQDQINRLRRARRFNIVLAIAVLASLILFVLATIWGARSFLNQRKAILAEEAMLEEALNAQVAFIDAQFQKEQADSARIEAENAKVIALAAEKEAKRLNQELESKIETVEVQREELQRKQVDLDAANRDLQRKIVEAQTATERALKSEKNARSLRKRALAQAVAAKSQTLDDPQLAGILARQAYGFNQFDPATDDPKVNFNPYDPIIYNALYEALTKLEGKDYNSLLVRGQNLHKGVVRGLEILPKDTDFHQETYETLYSTSGDGKVYALDPRLTRFDSTLSPINKKYLLPPKLYKHMAISNNGRWIAIGGDAANLYFISTKNPKSKPRKTKVHRGRGILDIVPFENNMFAGFISTGGDGRLNFHSLSGNSFALSEPAEQITSLAMSPDGEYLAGGTNSGAVYLWEFPDPNDMLMIPFKRLVQDNGQKVTCLSFGRNKNTIITGHDNGDIQVWDLVNATYVRRKDHSAAINNITVSPDRKLLATSSYDRSTRVWQMDKEQYKGYDYLPLLLTDDHLPWAASVAFDTRSKNLFVGYRNGIIKKWSVDPVEIARRVCSHLENKTLDSENWKRYIGLDGDPTPACE